MIEKLKNRQQYEALIQTLNQSGQTDVALEMQKLLNIDPTVPTIPIFGKIPPSIDENFGNYSQLLQRQKFNLFQAGIIGDDDISLIEEHMGYPNQLIIPINSIDFNSLKNQIGETKTKYIFSDTILNKYTTKSDGIFATYQYITFLKTYSKIQMVKDMLFQLDENSSTTIKLDVLRQFFEQYCPQIQSLSNLYHQEQAFQEYYIEIILYKLFFYISPVFDSQIVDLNELLSSNLFYNYLFMDDLPKETNPLSIANTKKIYTLFRDLDTEKCGVLSKENIKCIDSIKFTDVALDRMFDIFQLYQLKLDFYAFIIIFFSINDFSSSNATKFFFKIVDIDNKGVIDRSDILYFYKGIAEESDSVVQFDYYLSELFDRIQCSAETISEEDLIRSQQQAFFFQRLLDVNFSSDES